MLYKRIKAKREALRKAEAKAAKSAAPKPASAPRPPLDLTAVVYTQDGLKALQVKEQKQICKHLGIKGYSDKREPELIALILEAKKTQEGDGEGNEGNHTPDAPKAAGEQAGSQDK